ncbi:MAG TPA: hypothetical protein VKZ63_10045, partial [Kofleriaceae bacterium]|nr:hypothetical protein [Kofleriaceae bacterium]
RRGAPRAPAGEMVLTLRVSDPDVLAELSRRRAGVERERYAAAALRVGVLALRTAGGSLDADAVREAGGKLLAELRETLAQRATELTGEMARALTSYFDPQSGLVSQKLDRLVQEGGELERLLRAHVGDEGLLARTLTAHLGEGSPLFRMLSPDQADGLRAQIEETLASALRAQSDEVLRQFSLDHKDSALSRLIAELRDSQGQLTRELRGQVDGVVRELSLDHEGSALSRLVKNLTLDDEQSALSRLRRELSGVVEELVKRNTEFHADVRAALAAHGARKEEAARSTRHGLTFEDALGSLLAAEAQRVGDVHQATGATTGQIKNCKVGDHVITMGRDSAAPGVAIAFEAKEDRSYDLRRALDEIEKARKNRGAQIGVFVFSARTAPDGLWPLTRHGDDIVVVWDAEDEGSDLVIRCAYSMARGLATRQATNSAHAAEATSEIERATRAVEKQLQFLDDVARMAGTVESNGRKIRERMERMRQELVAQVERIDEQVLALRAAP